MASPFPDSTHKGQVTYALLDGGFAEAAIKKSNGAVEFSRTVDGVNWVDVAPVAGGVVGKRIGIAQQSASHCDRIVVFIVNAGERFLKASDALGEAGSWKDYEDM